MTTSGSTSLKKIRDMLDGCAQGFSSGVGSPENKKHRFCGGEAALKARPADERAEENARLKAKVGELTMEGEVLREKIDRLEAGRPLAGRRWRR